MCIGIKHGASKTSSRANRNLLRDRNTNSDSDEGEEEFKIKRKASARTPKTPAKTPKTPAKTKAVAVRKSSEFDYRNIQCQTLFFTTRAQYQPFFMPMKLKIYYLLPKERKPQKL